MLIDLPSPQVLDLVGADAGSFAQAQFCNDLRGLGVGQWQWNAWLSAQGRVRAWFHLLRLEPTRLRLILRGGSAARLRDALGRYVLRAKVALEVGDGFRLIGAETVEDLSIPQPPAAAELIRLEHGLALALPNAPTRYLVLDRRETALRADASEAAVNRWRVRDIESGIADLDMSLEDRFLPTWLGFDALGVISLGKGCYPGQEIIARMHFKGGNKRWLHQLAFSGTAIAVPGTELSDGDAVRGTLVTAAPTGDGCGVALAVLDAVSPGAVLRSDNATYEVVARFDKTSPAAA